jgi:hypothetical protein
MSTLTLARPTECYPNGITVTAIVDKYGDFFEDEVSPVVEFRKNLTKWDENSPTAYFSGIFDVGSPTRLVVDRDSPPSTQDPDFVRLIARLKEIANRKPDWDGDDGHAPTSTALGDAHKFLSFLLPRGGLPKSVYAPGDGEINFEWIATRRITEVGFSGDGTVSWFHRDDSGEKFGDERFDADSIERNTQLLEILGVSVFESEGALEMPLLAWAG